MKGRIDYAPISHFAKAGEQTNKSDASKGDKMTSRIAYRPRPSQKAQRIVVWRAGNSKWASPESDFAQRTLGTHSGLSKDRRPTNFEWCINQNFRSKILALILLELFRTKDRTFFSLHWGRY